MTGVMSPGYRLIVSGLTHLTGSPVYALSSVCVMLFLTG